MSDILHDEFDQIRTTINKKSDEFNSQVEIERKLCEELKRELAAKERRIAMLVDEKQRLQSTLINTQETSLTKVKRRKRKEKIKKE